MLPPLDLDSGLAIYAAKLGNQYRLPLADSVMLACAETFGALLWTQDADFAGVPRVCYKARAGK